MSMTVRAALSRCIHIPSVLALAATGLPLMPMAYAAGAADANKPLVVRIAHGGPVSGPIAALGKDEENGVRMAIEDLNARKLQLGGRNVQWKLEAGDDAGDPGQDTSLARIFCDKNQTTIHKFSDCSLIF